MLIYILAQDPDLFGMGTLSTTGLLKGHSHTLYFLPLGTKTASCFVFIGNCNFTPGGMCLLGLHYPSVMENFFRNYCYFSYVIFVSFEVFLF